MVAARGKTGGTAIARHPPACESVGLKDARQEGGANAERSPGPNAEREAAPGGNRVGVLQGRVPVAADGGPGDLRQELCQ